MPCGSGASSSCSSGPYSYGNGRPWVDPNEEFSIDQMPVFEDLEFVEDDVVEGLSGMRRMRQYRTPLSAHERSARKVAQGDILFMQQRQNQGWQLMNPTAEAMLYGPLLAMAGRPIAVLGMQQHAPRRVKMSAMNSYRW